MTLVYSSNPQHRDGNPNKSQWIITFDEEYDSFTTSILDGCCETYKGWGLHIVNGSPSYLGVTSRAQSTFMAKFVSNDTAPLNWHGYPADHRYNLHDIPSGAVLTKWLTLGYFTKAKIRKLTRGQSCFL